MAKHLRLRKHGWEYFARVPKRFAAIDPRTNVSCSLETTDRAEAERKVGDVHMAQIRLWEAQLKGTHHNQIERFEAARSLAASRGLSYRAARDLADGDLGELLARIEGTAVAAPSVVAADLGGVDRPDFKVNEILDRYMELSRDQLVGKDSDQRRRWHHPRKRAFQNLQAVIGNIKVSQISRDHALDFRDWWQERMLDAGMSPNSPNKDLQHIATAFKTVSDKHRLGLEQVFAGLRFKEGTGQRRMSLARDWIAENLLGPKALAGLNAEARAILMVMVNTGARPSEIINLQPDRIRLEGDLPCIEIRPDERQVKTVHAVRDVPLAGVSLEALKAWPGGFERYRGKANWSNAVGKYMKQHELWPSPDHSAYSLRHAFEDRLIEVSAPDRIAADLMGHATVRERYGSGPSLSVKADWVQRIAL